MKISKNICKYLGISEKKSDKILIFQLSLVDFFEIYISWKLIPWQMFGTKQNNTTLRVGKKQGVAESFGLSLGHLSELSRLSYLIWKRDI